MELHKCVLVKIYLPPTNQQNSKYYCYCGKHCYHHGAAANDTFWVVFPVKEGI